ncbi:hypothetical protein HII36_42750 [Nonomuraea sp. NN258]|uniref:hypothetical protein n=1 Tax=Nonomuraea antri TaxID=2730852 RepID=UPI00156871B4|nr:hypothetical protein [Nonomuraea antri]NRQ38502.1 hypothetical protein [Nonomuraea antri]
MRRLPTRLALVLVVLLAGCIPALGEGAKDTFESRAREVAARWAGSADDHAWRDGFVVLGALNPYGWAHVRSVPAWANLSAHHGVWRLATALPSTAPPDAEVRWPDGRVSRLPLISAARAYREFHEPADPIEEECPAGGCRPLRVTGARLGRVPVPTSRGTVQVPAWMFTVAGVEQKKVHVAVDPSAVSPLPERIAEGQEEVMAFDLVAGRPRELRLRYGYGACDTVHGARAYETDQVVVVDVDVRTIHPGGPCPAILKSATTTVALARPLGGRVLLDSGTGVPVLRRSGIE